MKKAKTLTVVLTLSASILIILGYMIATNKLLGTSYNSPIIISQDANSDNTTKVSTTELTKAEETKNTDEEKITVTSRSGKHEAKTEMATTETEAPEAKTTEINTPEEEVTEEAIEDPVDEAKPTYQGVELEYSARYNVSSSPLTKSKGVTYYNGHKETYYSQKVLAGKGLKMLNNNGRHVADDGTVRDGDGYIAVACNYLPKGSEIMTSLGPGKVYDTGGMKGKWIDIYVNW